MNAIRGNKANIYTHEKHIADQTLLIADGSLSQAVSVIINLYAKRNCIYYGIYFVILSHCKQWSDPYVVGES